MAVSRKTFEAAARAIKENRERTAIKDPDAAINARCDAIAQALADHFTHENPRFDRVRFLKAAGVL